MSLDQLNRSGLAMLADMADPAASLRTSAATFRNLGQHFSADWSERMAADADVMPELYRNFARQQRERAARLSGERA